VSPVPAPDTQACAQDLHACAGHVTRVVQGAVALTPGGVRPARAGWRAGAMFWPLTNLTSWLARRAGAVPAAHGGRGAQAGRRAAGEPAWRPRVARGRGRRAGRGPHAPALAACAGRQRGRRRARRRALRAAAGARSRVVRVRRPRARGPAAGQPQQAHAPRPALTAAAARSPRLCRPGPGRCWLSWGRGRGRAGQALAPELLLCLPLLAAAAQLSVCHPHACGQGLTYPVLALSGGGWRSDAWARASRVWSAWRVKDGVLCAD